MTPKEFFKELKALDINFFWWITDSFKHLRARKRNGNEVWVDPLTALANSKKCQIADLNLPVSFMTKIYKWSDGDVPTPGNKEDNELYGKFCRACKVSPLWKR